MSSFCDQTCISVIIDQPYLALSSYNMPSTNQYISLVSDNIRGHKLSDISATYLQNLEALNSKAIIEKS